MSDITKSVLLKIDIDNADGERRLAELRQDIDRITKSQKENTKETDAQRVAFERNAIELKRLQGEHRNLQSILLSEQKALNANKGSFEQVYNTWKAAEGQLKRLSNTMAVNAEGVVVVTKEYEEQAKEVENLKRALLSFNAGVLQGNLNVGNYGNTLDGMRENLKRLQDLAANLDVGSKEFEEAQAAAEKLRTKIQVVGGQYDELGNKIAKNSIKDQFNDIAGAAQAITGALGLAMIAAGDNEEAQEKLRKVMGAVAVAQTVLTIAQQKNDVVQTALTIKTKLQTLAQIALNNATKAFTAIGIIGVVTGIVAAFTAFQKRVSATAQAMDDANDAIVEQEVKLTALLSIARDTNESLDKRRSAVEEINKISPEFLGNLELEAINTTKAKEAIDAYLDSIKAKAQAEATYDILVEKTKELYDLTKDAADGPSFLDVLLGATSGGTSLTAATEQIKNLKKEIDELSKIYQTAVSGSMSGTSGGAGGSGSGSGASSKTPEDRIAAIGARTKEFTGYVGDLAREQANLAILTQQLLPLYQVLYGEEGADAVQEVIDGVAQLEQGIVGVDNAQQNLNKSSKDYQDTVDENLAKMQQQFEFAQNVAMEMGNAIAQTLGQSADNVREFQKEMLKITLTALKNALQTALAEGLFKELATKGLPGLITGAIITTAIQAAYQTAINNIEGFATGGRIKGGTPIQRSNGDDVLITAKRGEVILNDGQQRRLERMGGRDIWNRLGVPGFADGGFVPRQIAGEAAMNVNMSAMRDLQDVIRSMPAPVLQYREFATFERSVQYADKVGSM